MFCNHESEIAFLREQVRILTDRLVAMANPVAYQAVNQKPRNPEDYYGSSQYDQYEMTDEFGQKILMEKDINLEKPV